jgi:hypothetical protein
MSMHEQPADGYSRNQRHQESAGVFTWYGCPSASCAGAATAYPSRDE